MEILHRVISFDNQFGTINIEFFIKDKPEINIVKTIFVPLDLEGNINHEKLDTILEEQKGGVIHKLSGRVNNLDLSYLITKESEPLEETIVEEKEVVKSTPKTRTKK